MRKIWLGVMVTALAGGCSSETSGTGALDSGDDGTAGDTNKPDTTPPVDSGADTESEDTSMPADTAADTSDTASPDTSDTSAADASDTSAADAADTAIVTDTADSMTTDTADSMTSDAVSDGDASTLTGPLLWFRGDFALNNTDSLGRFDLGTATSSEVSIMRGTERADVDGFDVSPDGSKIAFSADIEVLGRHDLYVMNRDGSGITKLVTAPGAQDVGDVRFSPDGTKLAFDGDLEAAGLRDVYVIPVSGGTSKRVSPTRPSASSTLQPTYFAWSRNSQYVALTGDLATDGIHQAWATDVTPATPAPVTLITATQAGTTAGNGVQGAYLAWSSAGRVLFRGRLGTETLRGLYQVDVDGMNLQRVANSPTTAEVGSFGLSPDGTKVAFSADSMLATAYEIYVMPSDGASASTRVTSGTVLAARAPTFFEPLRWSPNGLNIAFTADYATDNKYELYVVAAAGGGEKRVAAIAGTANEDASEPMWTPDSTGLAFLADHRVANDTEVFRIANVTTADQTPTLVQGVVTGGDMFSNKWAP